VKRRAWRNGWRVVADIARGSRLFASALMACAASTVTGANATCAPRPEIVRLLTSHLRNDVRFNRGGFMTYTELSLLITAVANFIGAVAAMIAARRRR